MARDGLPSIIINITPVQLYDLSTAVAPVSPPRDGLPVKYIIIMKVLFYFYYMYYYCIIIMDGLK